jgi:hypothetical protein
MKGFKHGSHDVFPAGQQLKNEDGSLGRWMPLACIFRWQGNEQPLSVPVSWYPPELFDTEEEAVTYAAAAAREMIDAGRCKV